MKVYVTGVCYDYEDFSTGPVFLKKEKAMAFIKKCEKADREKGWHPMGISPAVCVHQYWVQEKEVIE